ncbi:hypothetical protein [Rathayibacter festucae]|uniref:hypothetical protein n=1 Tax=Rathayibacter festucae TaxID=110937 RepID=UPI000FD72279|nr:hypothetical protein [Rathayibacter festucae]
MSTTHTNAPTPAMPKQPRTVALGVALPWLLVAIMTFAVAGVITGWTLRSENMAQVNEAVASASLQQRQ